MTLPAPWKRRSRKQRGGDRRAAKVAKAAILDELRTGWRGEYAKRMADPKRRAARQAWNRSYRARRKPKPLTQAQRARRAAAARHRYALAKAAAVPLTQEQREGLRARWRAAKRSMTREQRDRANARRRAKYVPKLRRRFDRFL